MTVRSTAVGGQGVALRQLLGQKPIEHEQCTAKQGQDLRVVRDGGNWSEEVGPGNGTLPEPITGAVV